MRRASIDLQAGDLLLTGSPAGNAAHHGARWLRPGDVMEGEITGLGTQRKPVRGAPDAHRRPRPRHSSGVRRRDPGAGRQPSQAAGRHRRGARGDDGALRDRRAPWSAPARRGCSSATSPRPTSSAGWSTRRWRASATAIRRSSRPWAWCRCPTSTLRFGARLRARRARARWDRAHLATWPGHTSATPPSTRSTPSSTGAAPTSSCIRRSPPTASRSVTPPGSTSSRSTRRAHWPT